MYLGKRTGGLVPIIGMMNGRKNKKGKIQLCKTHIFFIRFVPHPELGDETKKSTPVVLILADPLVTRLKDIILERHDNQHSNCYCKNYVARMKVCVPFTGSIQKRSRGLLKSPCPCILRARKPRPLPLITGLP